MTTPSAAYVFRRFVRGSAVFAAVFGAMVTIGCWVGSVRIVQPGPTRPAMSFNTAVRLLLSGDEHDPTAAGPRPGIDETYLAGLDVGDACTVWRAAWVAGVKRPTYA